MLGFCLSRETGPEYLYTVKSRKLVPCARGTLLLPPFLLQAQICPLGPGSQPDVH